MVHALLPWGPDRFLIAAKNIAGRVGISSFGRHQFISVFSEQPRTEEISLYLKCIGAYSQVPL